MNEQNIMENNEVMEAAEEIVKTNSGLGVKIIGGVLIAAGAIYGGLKLRKKIKAKKEEENAMVDTVADKNVEDECIKVVNKKAKKDE